MSPGRHSDPTVDPTVNPAAGSGGSAPQSTLRHGAAFLGSGLVALAVDMGMLSLLTRGVGMSAFVARPIGIFTAMVAGWLCHRTFTFVVEGRPTLAEFVRYATVAWSASALNYAIYAGILNFAPTVAPEAALFGSSLITMVFSYFGFRFGVFAKRS
jgi:putative flippase GtrA